MRRAAVGASWAVAVLLVALAAYVTRHRASRDAPAVPVPGGQREGPGTERSSAALPPSLPAPDPARSERPAEATDAASDPAAPQVEARPSFEEKHAGRSAAELAGLATQLNLELDLELRRIAEQQFEQGLFQVEHHPVDARPGATSEAPAEAGLRPTGMGRVQHVSRYRHLGGLVAVETAYVTEAEHPELFEKLDERLWAGRRSRELLQAERSDE